MEWKFKFREDGILEVDTKGEFILSDFREMILQMTSDSRWVPGTNRLYDNRELKVKAIDNLAKYNSSEIQQEFKEKLGSGKLALLVRDIVDYASGLSYQEIVESKIESDIKIFRNYDEAIEWLKQ